jgi:interleukin-1 receptor-associated kinase 1/coatomer subunit beta'
MAVKLLYDMPGLDDEQFKREFNNLMCLQHHNIVRLVGYCHDTRQEYVQYNGRLVVADKIYRALCFEYAPNRSLHENLSGAIAWCSNYIYIYFPNMLILYSLICYRFIPIY